MYKKKSNVSSESSDTDSQVGVVRREKSTITMYTHGMYVNYLCIYFNKAGTGFHANKVYLTGLVVQTYEHASRIRNNIAKFFC